MLLLKTLKYRIFGRKTNMSRVKALYHIVFCTKGREMSLPLSMIEDLFRFIWKDTTDLKCRLIRIGGIQNHLHLLIDLHPSIALSDFIKRIKTHSSAWLRGDSRYPLFNGWSREYFATTVSENDVMHIINYIKGQREHHLGVDFGNELRALCESSGQQYDERDMR